MFVFVFVFSVCACSVEHKDGVGEWLHSDSDDDSPGGRWREAV